MADEIDRGQESGEVAKQGERANARTAGVSELDELGVSSQRVSEWRKLRNMGPEAVDAAIDDAKGRRFPSFLGVNFVRFAVPL